MKHIIYNYKVLVCIICLFFCCVYGCNSSDNHSYTIICSNMMSDTLDISIADLQTYLKKSIPSANVRVVKSNDIIPQGHLIVMVDRNDSIINKLCIEYNKNDIPTLWNSFNIKSFTRKEDISCNIYFLEGADNWAKQYAVYDFAERFLGIRYLKPDWDYIPVLSNFIPQLINTEIQIPDYKWRGLYPWHYNYNSRGLTTFCDINAHFVKKDWEWFISLGDWMIKNKQNAVLWFDDVFSHENISGQFPDSLTNYWAKRGIRQILGLGWASNEDLTTGEDWKRKICLNEDGKSVEDASWKRAICPQTKEYFQLADINIKNMKLSQPHNYIGLLIGYGENTWASKEDGVDCILHKNIPSSQMMIRDLNYVSDKMKKLGLGKLPLGFVTSTHSIRPGNPFETDYFINNLPDNAIFSMHTYQQSGWNQFQQLYNKIAEKNNSEHTSIKAFQIAEVAFICGADIPLLKPSILRRRSEHFNSLPKENTLGHLATLNTTQYLYWYNTYQLLKWQWHKDDKKWNEDNEENLLALFGSKNTKVLNEVFDRLICLEYVLPYTSLDSLLDTTSELRPPVQWGRYNPKTHPNNFGFLLWASEKNIENLLDAEESIIAILKNNEDLLKKSNELYSLEFYPIIRLTAQYYAIRVYWGKYQYYLNQAYSYFEKEGWNEKILSFMNKAYKELDSSNKALQEYNRLFLEVLHLEEPLTKENINDIQRDFVINPSHELMKMKLSELENNIKERTIVIK